MTHLKAGDQAPDFSAPNEKGEIINLAHYQGKKLVLYFYPKDDTSGCTSQAIAFTESIDKFRALSCEVIGVSKDKVSSHDKFKAKYDLDVTLASDFGTEVCETYGVWAEKSMYGRKYFGIERTTFLIDKNGTIINIWRKVKVPGHDETVLKAVQELV